MVHLNFSNRYIVLFRLKLYTDYYTKKHSKNSKGRAERNMVILYEAIKPNNHKDKQRVIFIRFGYNFAVNFFVMFFFGGFGFFRHFMCKVAKGMVHFFYISGMFQANNSFLIAIEPFEMFVLNSQRDTHFYVYSLCV